MADAYTRNLAAEHIVACWETITTEGFAEFLDGVDMFISLLKVTCLYEGQQEDWVKMLDVYRLVTAYEILRDDPTCEAAKQKILEVGEEIVEVVRRFIQ